jgi:TM2 domain-containing membrane protein YozV
MVGYIMEGFLVVLVVAICLFSIVAIAVAIFSFAKDIIDGIIETYNQADTVYLDSLSKKDTVINLGD